LVKIKMEAIAALSSSALWHHVRRFSVIG